MLAIAELVVFPVTALSDDTEPCADSFALDKVGVTCLTAIRQCASHVLGGCRAGERPHHRDFVGRVLADAPTDLLRALQALRDEQVEGPRAVVERGVAMHH
ncbi:hypothetical protein ACFQL8_15095 [Streptomyces goshikiensis]|uniref:hypothetical protein n=1 Tax=Streptomyces goshikiensis TaxID=1942 RepID=UPI001675BD16|nr:hypothetical protein [Streptomyces goshikiensis]